MYQGKNNAVVNTQCPFFLRNTRLNIVCEGIIEKTENIMKFESEQSKMEYQRRNCFSYPNQCIICKTLEKKY